MNLYHEFISITKTLNKELDIVPVLYGSLGLEKVTSVSFEPEDIDILVPLSFLEEKWNRLSDLINQEGYELVDLSDHKFRKNEIEIGIAHMEDLKSFANVDHKKLSIVEDNGATFKMLSMSDYYKVYSRSLLDGYRREKKDNKDQLKLNRLNQLMAK